MRAGRAGTIAAVLGALALPGSVEAWAPAGEATVRPGGKVRSEFGQCTTNFFFADRAGRAYLGTAGHCVSDNVGENRCAAVPLPVGAPVEIEGATKSGRVAYVATAAMLEAREADPMACSYNDFALVALDPADVGRANPTIPVWGGPTGMRDGWVQGGEKVMSYGNSDLRGDNEGIRPMEGYATGLDWARGWSLTAYMATPTVPGDSGSGFIDAAGAALSVLAGVTTAPPGAESTIDLDMVLAYARDKGGIDVRLVPGTEPFTGPVRGPGAVAPPAPIPVTPFPPAAPAPATPPATPPEPAAAPAAPPPVVRIARVRRRRVDGTAGAGAARVEVAIDCGGRVRWRAATGTRRWTLRVRAPLPRGRCTVIARALDAAGAAGPVARRRVARRR